MGPYIDPRQLEIVLVMAEELNTRKAAERLKVQPRPLGQIGGRSEDPYQVPQLHWDARPAHAADRSRLDRFHP